MSSQFTPAWGIGSSNCHLVFRLCFQWNGWI